ncbi:hypothetical protein HHK36_013259 [Tetracentron sinense]|uniref:Glycolipid transfer protein domain-containing protein n=1 Tax=Tetracentron sinense TaxID=13715 RepID=A0A834Z8E1_TETSI|nr:hypothetical protein HHK36_013259 [Tetracentron sinense]
MRANEVAIIISHQRAVCRGVVTTQVFAPHHGWVIRKAVAAGMHALPTKAQFLKKLNEDGGLALLWNNSLQLNVLCSSQGMGLPTIFTFIMTRSFCHFQQMINNCCLLDLGLNVFQYTWSNYKEERLALIIILSSRQLFIMDYKYSTDLINLTIYMVDGQDQVVLGSIVGVLIAASQ